MILHSIAYFCYLFEIHPSYKYETVVPTGVFGNQITNHTHYILVSSSGLESDNFYPFHSFFTSSGGQLNDGDIIENCEFIGIFGYYDTSEYALYVLLPMLTLGIIWIYRRFIA